MDNKWVKFNLIGIDYKHFACNLQCYCYMFCYGCETNFYIK